MTMIVKGDASALERYAAENTEAMGAVRDHAAEHGLIAHRFYGSEGQILVIDEWPDAESFQEFFAHMGPHIAPMMEAAGATEEPHPVFWRELETHDAYGWGA
jgi:quinol monooxygenase YgiN